MATLVICKNIKCMYAKKRKDKLYQCVADAIGITIDKKCDSFLELPAEINDRIKEGEKNGN